MNQFVVPQFIDVEDKIFGPITVRQFVLSVIGIIVILLSFRFADFSLALFLTIITGVIVLLFGFMKVNGTPFHLFLLNVFTTLKKPGLRIWNKSLSEEDIKLSFKKPIEEKKKEEIINKDKLSKTRLTELSLMVDTHGEYKGES